MLVNNVRLLFQISYARTLYRRDGTGADFEFDGLHGIVEQTKETGKRIGSHYMSATANSGFITGGLLANIAYQLLDRTQKTIQFLGSKTTDGLEFLQENQNSLLRGARDVLSKSGSVVIDMLESASNTHDAVVPEEREIQNVEEPVMEKKKTHAHKKKGKKKKKKKKKKNKQETAIVEKIEIMDD